MRTERETVSNGWHKFNIAEDRFQELSRAVNRSVDLQEVDNFEALEAAIGNAGRALEAAKEKLQQGVESVVDEWLEKEDASDDDTAPRTEAEGPAKRLSLLDPRAAGAASVRDLLVGDAAAPSPVAPASFGMDTGEAPGEARRRRMEEQVIESIVASVQLAAEAVDNLETVYQR